MSNYGPETKSKKKKFLNSTDEENEVPKKKKRRSAQTNEKDEDRKQLPHKVEKAVNSNVTSKDEVEEEKWTTEDFMELIKRMEAQLPTNDTISFSSRIEKLNWDQIHFGNHSSNECYDKWLLMRGKVRHFRLLSEILQDCKVWAEKPWAAPLSKKKTRHPEQPLRPLSSYMLFYMDKKNKIIRKYPALKLTDISRLIGQKYKDLPSEKKAYYIERAKENQGEYKEKLSKFYEKYPELIRVNKKQLKKTTKPLPPVKLYLKDRLQKHQNDENFNQQEFTEKYKEVWKNLSMKKKAFWVRLAKEAEEKYIEQLHDNLCDNENKLTTSYKSVISKEENALLDRLAGKPEKPPNSAYSLFSRLMLKDKEANYVEGEPKNRMREVASLWKELPEDRKKAYAEDVKQMHEAYKLEFGNYLESLPEEKRAEEMAKLQPKKRPGKTRQKNARKGSLNSILQKPQQFKNEPEKPPVTAWDLYKTEFFKKSNHLQSKVAFKQAADLWKTLSKKEVDRYKKKHQELKEQYIVDFERFLKTLSEDELKQYSTWKTKNDKLNEASVEEESSSEEELEEEDVFSQSSSSSSEDASEDGDSGVSEEEC